MNRTDPVKGIVRFYSGRCTCEQGIRYGRNRPQGKQALEWMRLSCPRFKDNAVRLALFVLAYNLDSLLRRPVLPRDMARRSLATLRETPVKTVARLPRHTRRLFLHMAEAALPRDLLEQILSRIRYLTLVPGRGTDSATIVAEEPVVPTDTGVRSRPMSNLAGDSGIGERPGVQQDRGHEGFATETEGGVISKGTCTSYGRLFSRWRNSSSPVWGIPV